MRHVLIVAYYFPPIGGIGSIRLARFASLLPSEGWEPTVLAPRSTPHAPDPHLRFPEDQVVRSRSIELSQVGRAALRAGSADTPADGGAPRPFREALRSAAYRYLVFPDAQVGWYPGAVSAGLSVLRRKRFDAIYSSAYPVTAHLVARTLSRRHDLPWIAEYRDPWSDRLPRDHPHIHRAQALERKLARDATTIVMPSPTWATHYGALWHADIAVVPNGYDGSLPARRPPARPTLAHVGSYTTEHDLTTLWQALTRMRARGHDTLPRVRFVGNVAADLRAEVANFGLDDLLESTGFLPHDDAMRELMSSSMLVASGIGSSDPAQRGRVSAKLFDYLASGLPVLYLSEADTDAAALLAGRPGCHVVRPGDVDGAIEAVDVGLTEGDQARDLFELSRETHARMLAQVLERARVRGSRHP
jgi:glycosyltransferase involved in cell wall biosynthesis